MKSIIHFLLKYIRILMVALVLLTANLVMGQTPGLIIKPATGTVLDPDGDGYVSRTSGGLQLGFQSNDIGESEIPFETIVRPDPLGDILKGPLGGFTEIVGTDADGNNAILTYTDGLNLFFRFRLSGYAPNSKSYSILVDSDEKFGFTGPDADPDARAGNPGFDFEIVLQTNFNIEVYDVNSPSIVKIGDSYSYEDNCQKSIALSTSNEDPDYFYDFYIPLPVQFAGMKLRYVATTGMSPSPAMSSGSASDVGGVTSKDISLDQLFTDLINAQTPTVPGQEVLVRTNCPSITGNVSSGATSVSGTSGDEGAMIRLYVNDVQVDTDIVSGGSWTISGLAPLVGGASIKATAEAPGKGESSATCNLTFVGATCILTPVAVAIENGDKGGRVTNVANYPVGTVFTLYSALTDSEFSDSRDNNPYIINQDDITRGTIDIGCGGTGNCLPDGSYYIVAQFSGQCASQKSFFCVGSAISASSTPVINNTIAPLSSYITGTNGVAGAVLYIYANGTQIGSKILTTGGVWSVPVPSASICNTSLTARQIAPSQCISAISLPVSIGSAITSAPTITIDKCTSSVTSVTGFSGELDGTIIQLYVNDIQRAGTALVSGGAWTFTTSPAITTGETITAKAINSDACKTLSESSAAVTLSGTTVLTGAYSIPLAVAEGDDNVSVDVSGVSGTYTLNLYIDGDKIGSKSFTGSGTVDIQVNYPSDIYTGGKLQVSLTEGTKCESALSPVLKTVECNTPSFTSSVISTPVNDKCVTTSGSITVTNSQTGVIYTPVDASGVVKGYSTLGTGNTISLTTYAFPTSGAATFFVKAQRIVSSGTCEATSTSSVSFNAFAPPQFTTHPESKIICNGESTTLTASWTGIGPFNVKWQVNNGAGFVDLANGGIYSQATATEITATSATLSISNVTGLDNYTYRCIVTDTSVPTDCQSTTSNTSTLTISIVTISNALVTNATSGNNGSIDITASGGNLPYMYDWHHLNGSGTFGELSDLTGLTEGTYTVTVKDANGCTYQQTFIVGGVNSINLSLDSKTNVSCYGANDGSFTVSASSGTAPYSYSIDNFETSPQTSGTFSDLSPGTYSVQARDANSKTSSTVVVTISEPFEMVIFAAASNPSVLLTDGSLHVTMIGGTSNFNYSLFKVGTATAIQNYSNAGSEIEFSNLSAGTYYINVTDANGCTASKLNIVLTAPSVETNQCKHFASHTFNDNNYSGSDQSPSYFLDQWNEPNDIPQINIVYGALTFGQIPSSNDLLSWSTGSTISRQIDLRGAKNVKLSFNIQAFGTHTHDDYTVSLYINGNLVPDATFLVTNGGDYSTKASQTYNGLTYITTGLNTVNTFEFRLSAGSAKSNFRIDDFKLEFDKDLSAGVVSTPSTCNNGKIFLSVIGGYPTYVGSTPVYLYDWDNDGRGDFDDAEDLTGLAPGTYKVSVKDLRNCTISDLTVEVENAPLTAITGYSDPTCIGGGSNGTLTATLSATGGGGPYTYQLYKGASEFGPSVYSANTSKTFTGLTPGTYYVKVFQAADNCNTQTEPITLTMPILTSTITAVGETTICSGNSTTVKVDITGSTSPCTVELSNGQNITNYTSGSPITVTPAVSTTLTVMSVTDASSCVSSQNTGSVAITINPVLPVGVSISASPSNEICSLIPVTFTATPTNEGDGPVYQWKRNEVNVGINNVTFTYTPANGDVISCELTSNANCPTGNPAVSNSITMSVNLPVGGSITGGNTPICIDSSTGTMTLSGYTGNIMRWERQINSGGWTNLNNGGNTTYGETVWSSGVWEYRVVVQSGNCIVYSEVKSITINPVTVKGWISGSSTPICEGASTGTMTLNGSTGSVMRWEKRLGTGSWTNINNTALTYAEIPTSAGTWEYRALVQSGSCSSVYSDSFSMVVNPTLTINLGANPTICKGTTTALIPYIATTGNPGGYSIDFDTSANNAGLVDVPGWGLPAGAISVNVPWNINVGVYHGNLTVFTYHPVCSSVSYPITIGVAYFSDLSGFSVSATDACQESTSVITVGSTSLPNGTYTVNYTLTGANTQAASNALLVVSGGNTGTFTTSTLANSGSTTITINSVSSAGCSVTPSSGITANFNVNDNNPVLDFSYPGSPYCQNAESPLPAFEPDGISGTFNSTEGLIFVSTGTGEINLAASTPGTYTVTNTIAAAWGCSEFTATATVTISALPVATISYEGSPFCTSLSDAQAVTRTGTADGSYSASPSGLSIDATTGAITPNTSIPQTYTVTYTMEAVAGCTAQIAISEVIILQDGSWTGAEDDDWNNPNNWACNQLPTLTSNVTIDSELDYYPIVSSMSPSGMARDIIIATDASVTVVGGKLQIAGNITNSGSFTATEGTIEMKGLAPQSIGASVFDTNTLMNLIINNPTVVSLLGSLNITDVVSPLQGNLNADGHLTLLSSPTKTALIEGVGTGNVTGNVNIQRYLSSTFGYKYFSSPFKLATVGAFTTLVTLTETFPTFYKYDENNSLLDSDRSGWVKYTEASNLLIPMAGYAANMGSDTSSKTFTMSGEVNNGTVSLNLENNNREFSKGFNLVGNPYPSPIDWNAAGWTKTNIDNAIYFFNAGDTSRYTGFYSSYVDGQFTGNGNNIIAAMQGFFVHVTNPELESAYPVNATLGMSNSVRVNYLNPVFKSSTIDPRPTLRLTAGFEIKKAIEDVAIVYIDPMANMHFEKEKDALKLENTDELIPNIYTLAGARKLSINGLSEPSDSVFYIPLGITTLRDGWINFRAENARDLPFMQVYLSDAETGKYHDLRYSPEARFLLHKGVYDHRFKLVFSKAPFSGEYPGMEKLFKLIRSENQIFVKVNLPVGTKGTLMVTNVLGQSILRKEVSGKETVVIPPKSMTGVYVITLVSGKRTESEKILMRQDYE